MAGATIGSRFGGWGAAIGGAIGFFGSEFGGLGQAGQNSFMNNVMGPSIQQRALAGGIEHASTQFVPFGGSLHASGAGFSHHAAMEASRGLMDLGNSASFRRETFDRFNTQDLSKITQASAHAGLMSGVDNPADMVSRVRDIAKSVNVFMELAKEPDIQRAIQTMGSMRASGLNLSETLGAVQNGRTFARMAGMTFQEMAEVGGGMGSSTFQSMGLSQGLGFRTGTANLGIASASQNAGVLSPQMMSMVGGAQGLANLNNLFSAGMLQLPMLAPGMMTANGGLNQRSIEGLMSGRADLFSMTGRGSNALTGMTGRHGIEGLGMAVAMQPFLQDQIGRMMAAQGPFAQRNMEDTQIANLARQMNMRGSAGFMTAAQAMGMSQSQALARAQELSSPGYFAGQRQQLDVQFREARAAADRRTEADRPTIGGTLRRSTFLGDWGDSISEGWHSLKTGFSRFVGGEESRPDFYVASTDTARRRMSRIARSQEYLDYARRTTHGADQEEVEMGYLDRMRQTRALADARGGRGLASLISAPIIGAQMSDADLRAQARSYAQSSTMSRALLIGNQGDERNAARNMRSTFGEGAAGTSAMLDFSRSIANMNPVAGNATQGAAGMLINGLFRAGTSFVTQGLIDPGNIVGQGANTGGQFRNAFVNAMVRNQGMSRDRANEIFSQHGEQIVMQAAPMARLHMNAEDRERLRANIDVGDRLRGQRGTALQRIRRDEAGAYGRILGSGASNEERSTYNTFMDRIEGQGREGTARYERSRYIMSAMAMAHSTIQHSGPENQRAAHEVLDRVARQAAQEGFSTEDINNMARRSEGLSSRFESAAGQRTALAFVRNAGSERTGRGILDRFQQSDQDRQMAQVLQKSAAGFADLGRGQGVLGAAFRGMQTESFSQEEAELRLNRLDRDQLSQLSQEGGFGRVMSREIRRFQQGDQSALRNINDIMMRRGERESALRNEYRQRHAGAWNWVKDRFRGQGGRDDDERRWIDSQMRASSEGEFSARRQMDESVATESTMQRLGVGRTADASGRGGDALLDASRELNEVTRNLRDVLQGGSLDNLVGGAGGGPGGAQ